MEKIRKLLKRVRESRPFIVYISVIRNFPLTIFIHSKFDSVFFDAVYGLIFFPFALVFFLFMRARYILIKPLYHLVGVVIVKNEELYIKEFVDYYKLLQFDKLYIYDNNSNDNTTAYLKPYIDSGFVILNTIKGKGRQRDVYNVFINRYGFKTQYATFIDCDEFIKVPSSSSCYSIVNDCFFEYGKRIGALSANWVIFGTSGYEKRPKEGGVIDNFIYRTSYNHELNTHLKFFAKPSCVLSIRNPHLPYLLFGYKYINQEGKIINSPFSSFCNSRGLMIYHYYTKSKEEYYDRINKGNVFTGDSRKKTENIESIDKDPILDKSMIMYIKEKSYYEV